MNKLTITLVKVYGLFGAELLKQQNKISGRYKTWNGTEPEVIVAQIIQTWTLGMLCQALISMGGELILHPRRRGKYPADSLEPHQAYETF